MKRRILFTSATAALVTLSASTFACGQNADSSKSNSNQRQSQSSDHQQNYDHESQGQNNKAPNGYIMLEENTVYMMAREPQQHLLRAHEQLEANNPKAAASELRLAGAYLKMQEARPGDQAKDVLSHWQQKLDQLASRVEKGDVKSQDLIHASNGANYALAKYFDQRAKGEIADSGKQVQAGYDLEAAADCFEQSMLWSNPGSQQQAQSNQNQRAKLQQQDAQAVQDARVAADRLISAQNLAENQQGEAQLAAGKTGPGHENKAQTSSNQNSSQEMQKAVDELSKCIDARGSAFQSSNTAETSNHSNSSK